MSDEPHAALRIFAKRFANLKAQQISPPPLHLEVETGGGACHEVVEVLLEIPAEDVLGHGLVRVEGLFLRARR